jgi:cyclic-di-GMP-binding protein
MPSFDVVSEVDKHEVANAVDQANREVNTRFDFKGTSARYEQNELVVMLHAESEFQLKQMLDILQARLTKRGVDIACLKVDEPDLSGKEVHQQITMRSGLDSDQCRKIVKISKDAKLKVQASIQGDKVRMTGKKRDDLQSVIALLKDCKIDMPLQFENFRD